MSDDGLLHQTHQPEPDPQYDIGNGMHASDRFMDFLLEIGPDAAADVTARLTDISSLITGRPHTPEDT
jgi:hypothetical protein